MTVNQQVLIVTLDHRFFFSYTCACEHDRNISVAAIDAVDSSDAFFDWSLLSLQAVLILHVATLAADQILLWKKFLSDSFTLFIDTLIVQHSFFSFLVAYLSLGQKRT